MKTITRIAAGTLCAVAALAGTTATASAAPSTTPSTTTVAKSSPVVVPNIHRVTCGTRTDWLRIFSNATTCWASPGLTNVTLYNVYEWCAGNNNGYLRTSLGIQNFKAHTCGVFPAGRTATVTQIVIYA